MQALHDDHNLVSFTSIGASPEDRPTEKNSNPPFSPVLPEGWQRLPTGMRGTRLFQFSPACGRGGYWVAVMTIDRKLLSRRFAAELHARAWLTIVKERRPAVTTLDLEELNRSFRTAAFLRSG